MDYAEVSMKITVGIIGGGASGMMAAIQAAKSGADVTILEHTDRIGKKILVTGNGKCNFTNRDMNVSKFYGENPEFVKEILSKFSTEETLQFFDEAGLLYKEKNGYFYPVSNQAASVLDVLRFALKRYGVKIITETEPTLIKKNKHFFEVVSKKENYKFNSVILACGGKAAPKTGSDGSGYELARKIGHKIIKPLPALVQLRSSEGYFKSISGVRFDGKIALFADGKFCKKEEGELQITDYGISGIAVFQLSRIVAKIKNEKPKSKVFIDVDCVPTMDEETLRAFLLKKIKEYPKISMEDLMQGILNKKMNLLFMKLVGIKATKEASKVTKEEIIALTKIMKAWRIPITETNGFMQCQVCAGGVDTKEVDLHCQSKLVKGLYIVGELLDVDGICGGYNLQWAWTSGAIAGRHAAQGKG